MDRTNFVDADPFSLDAADTLSTIMVDGLPDPVLFFRRMSGFIEASAKAAKPEQPRVVWFGEAAALLRAEGKVDVAIRFEQFRNDLTKTSEVDMLCAYASSSFHEEEDGHVSLRANISETGLVPLINEQ